MRIVLFTLLLIGCAPPTPVGEQPVDPVDPIEYDDDEPAAVEDDAPADADVTPSSTVTLTPGCTAKATLAGHPAWFFFTRPDDPCTGTVGRDRHAVAELTRLIGTVPAGGRIDGHIFSITVDSVAQALYDAEQRGVTVRLSTDGAVAASKDPAKTEWLDKLAHHVYCSSAKSNACVSSADGAISHTKLFVFSRATAPDGAVADDVAWFGSANQTYASGMSLYNNTVTVYGDASLYAQLRDYLDDLYARRRASDYYDPASGRGHLLAGAADVYVSPETQTDLVVNRLDDITPDADCRVRVMHAEVKDSRMAVVDELLKLKRGGCKVWIVTGSLGSGARAKFAAAGIPVHQMPIHDKAFLVYAKYGDAYQYRVYTGSQNLSASAAHSYDEIFVKLAPESGAAHPVYDAFYAHFNDAYNKGASLD